MKNHFRLKKAFSALLISYIAMLMVPSVLAWNLSKTANGLSRKSCIENTMNAIRQGEILFEKQIDILDSGAMQLAYDYTLQWILQMDRLVPGDPNVVSVVKFQEHLNSIFSDSLTYNNYSVLLRNDFIFHQTGMVLGREFYYGHNRTYEGLSYEEWVKESFYSVNRNFLPMQPINMNGVLVNAITYNYPIRRNVNLGGEADAVVQFLLQEDTLKAFFMPLLAIEGCQVHILNQKGQSLALLSKEGSEAPILMEVSRMQDLQGSYDMGTGSSKTTVVYLRSDKNPFIYAVQIPERVVMQDAIKIQLMSIIMIAICMSFELLLGIYFAWKYSMPIRNLVFNIRNMIKPGMEKQEANEYQYLEDSVTKLIETNQSMESSLRERKEKDRENFWNYLFSGEFRQNEDAVREASLVDIMLGNRKYCVVSVAAGKLTEPVLKEFKKIPGRGYRVFCVCSLDNSLVTILFGILLEEANEVILENVKSILKEIKDKFPVSLKAGVGRVYANETDITFSYMQSCYSVRMQTGEDEEIVLYQDISQDMNALYYPFELEEKLVNCTKHGEIRQIEEVFIQLNQENISKRHLTKTMERVLVSNVAATLLKVYTDIVQDEQVNRMVEQALRFTRLSEALETLKEQFIRISGRLADSKGEREEQYFKRLSTYMEESFSNSQLCVAMAAQEFSLSESYFSQFFKEIMGDAFSSYLENIRLNKAKELIDTSDYDIEQIGSMVGYNNSGTFRRAFKRVTGISPSAWKQREK